MSKKIEADGGGLRHNTGKTLLELVPPEWEYALADVTTIGNYKYPQRNWERGMKWSIMIGCAKRHIAKFMLGERYDGDKFDIEKGTTGCHHLAMAAWNLLALMVYDLRQIGENDLPKLDVRILERINAESGKLLKEIRAKETRPRTRKRPVPKKRKTYAPLKRAV